MIDACQNVPSGTGQTRATVFNEDGTTVDIGTLGGLNAAAAAINDQGQITGFADRADGQSHAFLYKDGVMQDLGTLGGTVSNGNGINNKGEIIGYYTLPDNSVHAFLYKDGVMYPL